MAVVQSIESGICFQRLFRLLAGYHCLALLHWSKVTPFECYFILDFVYLEKHSSYTESKQLKKSSGHSYRMIVGYSRKKFWTFPTIVCIQKLK
jgi:hypothetical protein